MCSCVCITFVLCLEPDFLEIDFHLGDRPITRTRNFEGIVAVVVQVSPTVVVAIQVDK